MRTLKQSVAALGAAAGITLAMAVPAHAGLLAETGKNCDSPPSARVFLPWLDLARYVPAPGGAAESARGWQLEGGARIVSGNEPWKVGGGGQGASLLIPAGSRATTAAMCVGLGHPTMRFFARRSGGSLLSPLAVEVLFDGLGGALRSLPIGVVLSGGQWQPTLPYPVLANLLPLLPGEQTPVAFRFTPLGAGASWQLDDVYVDPWRAK